MSRFLWVEDFEEMNPASIASTTGTLFKGIINSSNELPIKKKPLQLCLEKSNIIIVYSFLEAILKIRNKKTLRAVDFIILDIDLPVIPGELEDKENVLNEFYEWYYNSQDRRSEEMEKKVQGKLKKNAGYHIYLELIHKLGFPGDRILICSNHGEELKTWNEDFNNAKIKPPELYTKEDKEGNVNKWIRKNYINSYSVLRRGILECCQDTKQKIRDGNIDIVFQNLVKERITVEEMIDFLETIEIFLPLKEPIPKEKRRLFKLLVRTISQDWDKVEYYLIRQQYHEEKGKKAFAFITKMVRNWASHTDRFSELNERQVAFFIMAAMRSMFGYEEIPERHELLLFRLFEKQVIDTQELRKKFKSGSHPLARSYVDLKKIAKKEYVQREQFREMLDALQRSNKIENEEIGRLCFQMFWHTLFPIVIDDIDSSDSTGRGVEIHYSFSMPKNYFEKKLNKNSFFFQFAQCIYLDSFG
jgi:hypothetical protein